MWDHEEGIKFLLYYHTLAYEMIIIIFPSSTRRELISRRENNFFACSDSAMTRENGFKVKEGKLD